MRIRHLVVTATLLLCFSLIIGFAAKTSARASTTITVTTTTDELNQNGNCSLREAIQAANTDAAVDACPAGNGADTIILSSGFYTLTIPGWGENANQTGSLDINGDLNLQGDGAEMSVIDGGGFTLQDRPLWIGAGRVTISGVTLQNGRPGYNGAGGGVFVEPQGSLTLQNMVLKNNESYSGGAIANGGQLTVINTMILNNRGIYRGGGISSGTGTAFTVTHSSIISNTSINEGGGGIRNFGSAIIENSNIVSNTTNFDGGGIDSSGTLEIYNSTLAGNTASVGGGLVINYGGLATLTDSTISGNSANGNGGGLADGGYGAIYLNNVTVANNTVSSGGGGGIYANNHVYSKNTLIATNIDTSGQSPDCSGTLELQGFDLIGNTTGCTISGILTGVITNTAPLLGNLQDNGGSTWTHALLPRSPALDQIPSGTSGCGTTFTTDQRGLPRPAGDKCDIGAYEYQSTPSYYTLTVAVAGDGSGVVTTNPIGPSYLPGTVVTLTAMSLISSTFTGWNGDVIAITNPVTLTLDANKFVTATFILDTYILTPTAGTNGSITPATPQTVNYGASQTFTITPDIGYHIVDVGVDGVSQGPIGLYTFNNVTANHSISAAFAVNLYTLTLNSAGNGSGSVMVNPPGPAYTAGTVVTLTAIASSTSRFTGWSSAVISTTNPLIVPMDSDKTITTTFVTQRVYLPLVLK
jgi:CSLREA domain-containing protein